jgi:CRISPR type IV-associated protein Csf1
MGKAKPTQLLYEVAGRPPIEDLIEIVGVVCCLCGNDFEIGWPYKEAIKDTFNDRDKLADPNGAGFCPACAFSFQENIIINNRERQRMRNYSHMVGNGRWQALTKGDKDQILEFLLTPKTGKWLACIAESGQKHLLFRAPVNFGPGNVFSVQFEERQLRIDQDLLRECLEVIESLMLFGFSKTEIETGNYLSGKLGKVVNLLQWQGLESQAVNLRGLGEFDLALFLAQQKQKQKEEVTEVGRQQQQGDGDESVPADGGILSSGNSPFDKLGYVGKQAADLLANSGKRDKGQQLHDQPGEIHQLALWEDGD